MCTVSPLRTQAKAGPDLPFFRLCSGKETLERPLEDAYSVRDSREADACVFRPVLYAVS